MKRRRKKLVIETSEDEDSVSQEENTERAIVLYSSEQQQINSDGDFVDPLPRVKKTQNIVISASEKKKKKENSDNVKAKTKRSLRKDKTQEQQPYYEYDGRKINIRCAVNNLPKYLKNLSKEQKKAVREIGFASALSINLHSVPRKFGYWLVNNFDAENDMINTGDEKIKITTDLIQKVFQIPNGKVKIEEKMRPKDTDPIIKLWRGQFSKELLKKLYIANLIRDLEKSNELGRMFKLNFLVIFCTVMAEAMQSSNVNQRFLPSMKSNINIQDFSWCEYMLNCLRRTRKQWPGANKTFNGPIGMLAILYAYKKQGFEDREQEYSLDKIDSTTLQEFEDELEIAAKNEGRVLVKERKKKEQNVAKKKQKKKDEEIEYYVYPSESDNKNEEIYDAESEEKNDDNVEELNEDQPHSQLNCVQVEEENTLLTAALNWIALEDTQNGRHKTNETEKTPTESAVSWGHLFEKPSEGKKEKLWVDSQCRSRNFMPSQIQIEKARGLSEIHSTKSGDEILISDEGEKNNEQHIVSTLDDHFKGFEESFQKIQSYIDDVIEQYPNSEIVHNKVNEWPLLMEKFNDVAKKRNKVTSDSRMIETPSDQQTPSSFLNLN